MSLRNGKDPLLNRPATASPSPAHEALMSHLEAAAEPTGSLKKRKSWFGSLRDVMQKGAKAAFGYGPKGEPDKHGGRPHSKEFERAIAYLDNSDSDKENNDKNQPQRPSIDSMSNSLAFTLSGNSEHRFKILHQRFGWNGKPIDSLHLPQRARRASDPGVPTSPSSEAGMRTTTTEPFPIQSNHHDRATHARKSSVAESLVGSIRGMSRRVGKTKLARADTHRISIEESADMVPLPSSPIDIPSAPPCIDMDLGTTGFMTPMFGRSPERAITSASLESKKLMDPNNITSGVPPPTPVLKLYHPPVELADTSVAHPAPPRPRLRINIKEVRDPVDAPGPQTPMPGTNMTLELDGNNSEKSDRSHVFERSVTPSFDKESKQIRKMRSLDAVAEACTVDHTDNEMVPIQEYTPTRGSDSWDDIVAAATISHMQDELCYRSPVLPPVEDDSSKASIDSAIGTPVGENQQPQSAEQDFFSLEEILTLESCPEDLPKLERQLTPGDARSNEELDDMYVLNDGADSVYEDPFDEDPFGDGRDVRSGSPSPNPSMERRLSPTEPEDTAMGSPGIAQDVEPYDSVEYLNYQVPHPTPADSKELLQSPEEERTGGLKQHSPEVPNPAPELSFEEIVCIREQRPLCCGTPVLDLNNTESAAFDGTASSPGPIPPAAAHVAQAKEDSSSRGGRFRSTVMPGLQEIEYRFSFDNWLKETCTAAPPGSQLSTPSRRRMDMSLDSVSTNEERKTPQVSPSTTTNFEGTPTLGSRKNFSVRRAGGNASVDAMHEPMPLVLPAMHYRSRNEPRFILGATDDTEAFEIPLANFEHAYGSGSREATPKNNTNPFQSRVASDDSVADSLKNAALDYSQLEEQLADIPPADDADVFADRHEARDGDDGRDDCFHFIRPLRLAPRRAAAPPQVSEDNASAHFEFKPAVMPICQKPEDSSPLPIYDLPPSSDAESPSTVTAHQGSGRAISGDTLDRSLKLFMSSEGGYQADESSVCQENSSAVKARPARYRRKTERGSGVLSEVSDNSR